MACGHFNMTKSWLVGEGDGKIGKIHAGDRLDEGKDKPGAGGDGQP